MTGFSFQTRARTIDHLGRGQIADSPTAVSELWKNAYDAYATQVALNVYRTSDRVVAAIFDDGIGMNLDTILSKWMVLGTESKARNSEEEAPDELEFRTARGLSRRTKQGEKGIGRLSVAFLAPSTLLVSKKEGQPFALLAIDWRLFENPYLSLSDITVPVLTCTDVGEIIEMIPLLAEEILANFDRTDAGRTAAWERYTAEEEQADLPTTADEIRKTWTGTFSLETILDDWNVASGKKDSGTALILNGAQRDLAAWVTEGSDEAQDLVKNRFSRTLTAFTDPLTELDEEEFFDPQFNYSFTAFPNGSLGRPDTILDPSKTFGVDRFQLLEHQVHGSFDHAGVFTGRVVAFGKDQGVVEILPAAVLSRRVKNAVGPFSLAIGAYEAVKKNSAMRDAIWTSVEESVADYSGIAVYRDGLRVLPYGRPDSDFFEIEETRSKNAGRAFWSHRRTFGRIAFTRRKNPNLRDKAGREGLVDNKARSLMKELVIGVLTDTANRYFGSDSAIRKPEIAANNVAYEQRKKASETLKQRSRIKLNVFLTTSMPKLEGELRRAADAARDLEAAHRAGDSVRAIEMVARWQEGGVDREALRPPAVTPSSASVEQEFRDYKDSYRELLATLDRADEISARIAANYGSESDDVIEKSFHRNEAILSSLVGRLHRAVARQLSDLSQQWDDKARSDTKLFRRMNSSIFDEKLSNEHARVLNAIEARRHDLVERLTSEYDAFGRALVELAEGIDLEGAASVLVENASVLEQRLQEVMAVAQVGISVEIIGHELEVLDGEVRRNLRRLPDEIRASSAYRNAFEAHASLTDRIRFLAPLKIAGYRNRELITGREIANYMRDFFGKTFSADRIQFEVDSSFENIRIRDMRSRIYPSFINLLNNSAYWLSRSEERRLRLSTVDGLVAVSDSGPGVHPDDVDRLFSLYFSRRSAGRGIGLYLVRANLAVAGHTIRYAGSSDPHPLSGANFLIDFKGIEYDV